MVFNDIQKVVRAEAFPWFERYAGDEEVLRTLLHDKEKNQGGLSVGTWGIGNIPSPWRDYLTGYVALGMGQKELAWTHLSRALNSGCYKKVESRIKKDLAS
jgi:hypothetical protein